MTTPKKKPLKIIGSILFYGFLAIVLATTFLFAFSTDENKSVFGYRFYEVLSGSMRPTIDVGELVIIKMCEPEDVEVGDVVTKSISEDGSLTLTHRVIEKYIDTETGTTMVVTQGDNNISADQAMPADEVIGTMEVHIPVLGYVVGFIKENVFYVVVLLVVLAILFAALRTIFFKKPQQQLDPDVMENRARELMLEARELYQQAKTIREQQQVHIDTEPEKAPLKEAPQRSNAAGPTKRPAHAKTNNKPIRRRQDFATPAHKEIDSPLSKTVREKGERGAWPVVPIE